MAMKILMPAGKTTSSVQQLPKFTFFTPFTSSSFPDFLRPSLFQAAPPPPSDLCKGAFPIPSQKEPMTRPNMIRRIVLFLALGAWGFLLVSMASFHPDDCPSHQVYPYPPIQNLCGAAGAFVAYQLFFAIGQGIFPILLFSGLCLALLLFHNRISDLWLRGIGLALLSIAFAALVHLIKPGSSESFPEGHGGIIGISASTFLKSHFNTAGSGLILITTFLVGLLLADDDLVIRAPAFIGQITQAVRQNTPQFKFRFPALPKFPSLPGFVTRDAKRFVDDDTGPLKPAAVLRRNRIGFGERLPADKTVNGQQIDLVYENDAAA